MAKVVELVLDSLGLTVNQYRTLSLIAAGAPPMREFALRLAMKPPNLTTLVDGLVARELVSRERDTADRRRVTLALTPSGGSLLAQAETRASEALAHVASFDDQHKDDLLSALDDWEVALDLLAIDLHKSLEP